MDEALAKLGVPSASRSRRRWWLALAGVLIVAIAGGAWLARRRAGDVAGFETARVQRRDLSVTVTATGSLKPVQLVEVGSEVSGRVSAVHVDVNDTVTKGEVLVEIDPTPLRAALAEARANVASAVAQLRLARATAAEATTTLARMEALNARGLAATQELESAAAAKERAAAEVQAASARQDVARAAMDEAETNLERAIIRAPIDGIVLARTVEPGQTVAATFQAPVLLQLAPNLDTLRLHVDIDEADVGRVNEGQRVTFVVDAYPSRTFEAQIRRIHYAAKTVDNVVTYEGVLDVDNAERLLRPGMTATATIVTSAESGALTVPNAALRFEPPHEPRFGARKPSREPGPRVWVEKNGVPTALPVRAGRSDGRYTAIEGDGITEGLAVIIDVSRPAGS